MLLTCINYLILSKPQDSVKLLIIWRLFSEAKNAFRGINFMIRTRENRA